MEIEKFVNYQDDVIYTSAPSLFIHKGGAHESEQAMGIAPSEN
jgi:hypothetical protein